MILLVLSAHSFAQDGLAVISNPGNETSELPMPQLEDIFLGEKTRWSSGKAISLALMKTNHTVGELTASKLYDMSGQELNKYWLSLVFQGKAKAPQFFTSEDDLVNYVKNTLGAIGIVAQNTAGSLSNTIKIDGKTSF